MTWVVVVTSEICAEMQEQAWETAEAASPANAVGQGTDGVAPRFSNCNEVDEAVTVLLLRQI